MADGYRGGEAEGRHFGQPGHGGGVAPGGVTPGLGQVADGGVGTAVEVVHTADRLQGRRRLTETRAHHHQQIMVPIINR